MTREPDEETIVNWMVATLSTDMIERLSVIDDHNGDVKAAADALDVDVGSLRRTLRRFNRRLADFKAEYADAKPMLEPLL